LHDMRDNDDPDLEALIKTAEMLSGDNLNQFIQLIPIESRQHVQEGLARRAAETSSPTTEETEAERSRILPPTIIVEPVDEQEHPTVVERKPVQYQGPQDVKLVKLHAKGAVGEVFIAFDEQLSRELALKRVRPDLPHNERRFKRFVREAEITAKLQHPGIVPIYDLHKSDEDTHYTMPLVSGSNLSTLITNAHKEIGNRTQRDLWLANIRPLLLHFIAVCNAIDYAHSQQVLHRDIKPENIMIGTQGQTLVLDWGCAKDLEDSSESSSEEPQIEDEELANILGVEPQKGMTLAGSVMGTIEFMSPEQAAGEGHRIGTHSDVFGLGASLFNVLTNEVAFEFHKTDGSSVDRALEDIRQGRHRRVEEVDTRVPPALAAICHKAMAFAPEDRYATAGDLGRDVDSFLAGAPVSSYEEPFVDKATRYVKRHRTAFTTLLGTLLVGFLSLTLVALMVNSQRKKLADKNSVLADLNGRLTESVETEKQLTLAATVRENENKQQLYNTEMLLASEASSEPGGFGRMRQLVKRWHDPELDAYCGWELKHLDAIGHQELWKTDLDSTLNRIIYTRDNPLGRVFDFSKSTMFTIDTDSSNVVGKRTFPPGATSADLNRDQSLLALGYQDGNVVVFNLEDDDVKPVKFRKLESAVTDVQWNIGGDYLAASDTSGELVVWQWYERKIRGTGKEVLNIDSKRLLNWSYDGKKLYWTTGGQIRELDMKSGNESVVAEDNWIVSPCWSHEGKLLAWVGANNVIRVLDPETGKKSLFSGHQLFIETLNWHPNKHYLLSSSADGSMRIWNVDDEKEIRQLLGHGGHVFAAAWNSNGSRIVSGGLPEDQLHVWDVENLGSLAIDRELQDHPDFAWHPDGIQLAVAEGPNIVIQDDAGSSTRLEVDGPEIYGIALESTGGRIACVSQKGKIWTVDAQTGKILTVYDEGSEENLYPELTGKSIAWSPGERFLAGIGAGGTVKIWDESTGENVVENLRGEFGKCLTLEWNPASSDDAPSLAFAGTSDYMIVVDPVKQKVVKRMPQYGWTTGLAWSPDGTRIAASERRSIRIWNVESESQIGTCEGPSSMIRDISWSKSQERIAAIAEDGLVCIWNEETFSYCAKFKLHQRSPYTIRWSPDGKRLVSTARHGRIVFQNVGD